MTIILSGALFSALAGAAAQVAQPTAEQAGASLAAGRTDEAAYRAAACLPDPRCALVRARALFALGSFEEAAKLSQSARTGQAAVHAAKLQGESLILAGDGVAALEPLEFASQQDPDGPAGVRAGALLADAFLEAGRFAEAADQARKASETPHQQSDIRVGLELIRAEALSARVDAGETALARDAAMLWRAFWLDHPEHPAADKARPEEERLTSIAGASLPEPAGRELLSRAQRLLGAGKPAAAVAQAEAAAGELRGADEAEAQLVFARALAADGRRTEAGPALLIAWQRGAPRVAASAGLLLARDRMRRGNDPEAVRILDQLARRYPQSGEADEAPYIAARLQLDQGKEADARRRLARIARQRGGAHGADARWTLAWLSYRRGLRDAGERFAAFTAAADSDALRAQGLYWQARVAPAKTAGPLLRRVIDVDPLGYYGLLARQRLGQIDREPPPFPPAPPPASADPTPARLSLASELFQLGLLAEAGAEADRFVRDEPARAALALPVYERAQRYDRSFALAQTLLGWKTPRPDAAPELLEGAYPAAYADQVAASAARAGVDPYLVLAIARRESLFRPDTRSAAGAVGLMQLLPATARRAAIVLARPPPTDADMADPRTAIDLGAWYLSELLGRFGDAAIAAAAYNAGPRVAAPWAARGAGQPLDRWVEEIPYRETRTYVKVVLGAWSAYRLLAGGSAPALADTVPSPRPGAAF
ncbi:MAG TPA: lytic transglycosylase domain-containing protein [Myxococcales bacterium]|nr:lytic transglycosylase domain-containing protein [Myxococcales bacterium]